MPQPPHHRHTQLLNVASGMRLQCLPLISALHSTGPAAAMENWKNTRHNSQEKATDTNLDVWCILTWTVTRFNPTSHKKVLNNSQINPDKFCGAYQLQCLRLNSASTSKPWHTNSVILDPTKAPTPQPDRHLVRNIISAQWLLWLLCNSSCTFLIHPLLIKTTNLIRNLIAYV